MKLKILVEVGPKIGLGHFTRCLALADMVSVLLEEVVFYSQNAFFIADSVNRNGYHLKPIFNKESFLDHLEKEDIVVLDGYGFDYSFQKKVKKACKGLMLIDDLCNQQYEADYIVNIAPGVKQEDYQVSENTKLLLGPDYSLLRKAFLNAEKAKKKSEEILICFGGADPRNLSLDVVNALLTHIDQCQIHLILGKGYALINSLKVFKEDRRLKISVDLDSEEMAESLKKVKFAIVPSSGILYECLAVGTLAVSGYYVDNQKNMYDGWLEREAIIGVENFDLNLLISKVKMILKNDDKWDSEIRVIDGHSPERYRKVIANMLNL